MRFTNRVRPEHPCKAPVFSLIWQGGAFVPDGTGNFSLKMEVAMPSILNVHAVHQGEMRIDAQIGEFQVKMDYPRSPEDTKAAPTPLELILASLAGCAGNTVAVLLQKMRQPMTGLEVNVKGHRRDEHPTVLTDIDMEILIHGSGIDPQSVEKVMKMSEGRICSVWNMLTNSTKIIATYKLDE